MPPESVPSPSPTRNGDTDHAETREWLDSLDAVLQHEGPARARFLLGELEQKALRNGVELPFTANTPYINTIPADQQPLFPGNREIERRIKSLIRWNAMAMVVRANKRADGIGGHISTYASAATLTKSASTTSSAARTRPRRRRPWSTSRATPRPASTPAPFSKAA